MQIRRWLSFLAVVSLVAMVSGCNLFNAAPVANFTWSPNDPLARTDVQFTDLSTDTGGLFGGGGVVSWLWDFGDNGSSPSQNPKHSYAKGGTYSVRLTVTDGGGSTASSSRTITVIPSLDGRWNGTFTTPTFDSWAMSLDLSHSATGGISGMLSIINQTFPIQGAMFNAVTREVSITVATLVFRGILDAAERRISGWWYDQFGVRGEDWFVSLQ